MFSRLNITTMNPSTQSFVIILFILVFRDSSIKCTNMLWYICIFDIKFRMYYITSTCDTKFRAWCEVLTKIMHLNYSHMTSKLTENTWYTFLFFSFSFFIIFSLITYILFKEMWLYPIEFAWFYCHIFSITYSMFISNESNSNDHVIMSVNRNML